MSTDTTATPKTTVSERRLAANRVNAQLSTGPRTPKGKAKSSLNAVKTGLAGRTVLLADEEEASAYRAHVKRLLAYWRPEDPREHALVQSLADTQWRLDSIPGLESALYALGRERSAELFPRHNSAARRLLLDGQTEMAEAKALKNLRLHESRLRRRYQQDEDELERLRALRFAEEKAEKKRKEEQKREGEETKHRNKQAARKEPHATGPTPNGFEFSTSSTTNLGHSRESTHNRIALHQNG